MHKSTLANADVRAEMKCAGVTLWQIADALNVCEMTVTRRFRREMNEPAKREVFELIAKISSSTSKIKEGQADVGNGDSGNELPQG